MLNNYYTLGIVLVGVILAGLFPLLFIRFFKRHNTQPGPFVLHKDPINGNSRALGINDDDEFQKLQDQLADALTDLDEANRQLKCLRKWLEEFEDLTDWMHTQGFWNGDDVDEKNPMQTYKNGLTRFLRVIS